MSEKIEKKLENNNEVIDQVTGFLVSEKLSIRSKTSFLKALKILGNQSSAAEKQGISWSEMENELRKDLIFNKAYLEVLTDMKHELEGILYTKAIEKKDAKSAILWLSAKFPEEYRAGTKKTEKKQSKDKIFDSLLETNDKD